MPLSRDSNTFWKTSSVPHFLLFLLKVYAETNSVLSTVLLDDVSILRNGKINN